MPDSSTPVRSRGRFARRILAASVAGLVGAAAWATGAADARIAGDHHSPAVTATSTTALQAFDAFETAGTPGAFVAYVQARDATADAVAAEMQLDAATLRSAWARADLPHQEAVLAALTQLGVPYIGYKSEAYVGFDCSGLTSWAWARAGVQLAHQSGVQIRNARAVEESSAVAGDLLQYPGHVMLYLGVGRAIVHASNPSTDVSLSFVDRSVKFGDPTG